MGIATISNAQIADSLQRKVVLQGSQNFRDLGGYKTQDGKQVKWGQVYRSADISKLTDSDLQKLQDLHDKRKLQVNAHRKEPPAFQAGVTL